MIISSTFFLNAAFNFILGFAVAAVLGPEEFGRYAIGSMISVVISTACFDWLRLSVTRRYNAISRKDDPVLRASLDMAYRIAIVTIVGVAFLVMVSGFDFRLSSALIVAVAAASIATGQFELWMALARARFLNGTYATLVISKNVVAFGLMVGAAWIFHSATAVLAALALSVVVIAIPVWRTLRDRDAPARVWGKDRVIGFARYGVPVVAANVIFQGIVLINRWVASSDFGFAEAGQLSFATDLGIRLMIAVGAGFDVLLFQLAVRQEAMHGKVAAQRQMATNMVWIAAVLIPLAAGYAAILPAFTSLFVPASYRIEFGAISLILIPGVLAYSVTQFIVGPIFQMEGSTRPMVYAALSALGADLLLLACLPHAAGSTGIALVHTSCFFVALTVATVQAWRLRAYWPPLRTFGAILVSTAAMALVIWPMRSIAQPWIALLGAVGIGVPVYALLLLAFNVAGLRQSLSTRLFVPRGIPADL